MTHDVLAARLEQAMAKDVDHMVAGPNDILWLMTQLACWPERVDPDCTTNDRFLRFSAVATIQSLLAELTAANASVEEAEGVIEPFAAIARAFELNAIVEISEPHFGNPSPHIVPTQTSVFRKAAQWLADRGGGRSDG